MCKTSSYKLSLCNRLYDSLLLFVIHLNSSILQTEQMGRIVNELDTIQFSIKKASQLVKEIGRQVTSYSIDHIILAVNLL